MDVTAVFMRLSGNEVDVWRTPEGSLRSGKGGEWIVTLRFIGLLRMPSK